MQCRHPRLVLISLVLGVLIVAAPGCGSAKPTVDDPSRPLIWAADLEGGAPYVFKDKTDRTKVVGFEKDIADALARELGRPIEFKQYPFNSLVPGLLGGDFDFAMNGLEITPDRQAKLRFSRPYYVYRQQLVMRNDEKRFSTYDELKKQPSLKVGTLEDTAAYRMLKRDGFQVKVYEDSVGPYKDLEQGAIDAVLQDLPIAVYLVQKQPEFNSKLKFAGPPVEPGLYAITFKPTNEALAKQVDQALERMIKSGELRKILEKWELWNDDQKVLDEGSGPDLLKKLKA